MKHWRGRSGLVTSLGRVPLICSLALGASATLGGCSSDSPGDSGVEQLGTLGVHLDVAPGVTLDSVTYTITGNGFTKSGSIDTSGAPTVTATIGGIPAGNAYTITLTATSAEGGTSFTGSANFNVTAGKTTSVTVHLRGTGATGNGSVTVNGTLNVGPVVDELTATPLSVFVGKTVKLQGVGRDPDAAPAPLSYYWSTTGGVVADPIAANTTLTSATPGTFTVKFTVSDGELTQTATTTVTFVEPDGAGGGGGNPDAKPNILLVIADDLGAESVSLYPELVGDSGAVPTPNLEKLAESGLVFDNAWSSPACSPTRGTIVSGSYAHQNGVVAVGQTLPTNTVTLFDRITAESPSYQHAVFGKYHLAGGASGNLDPRTGAPYPQAPGILQHIRDIGITYFRGIVSGGLADYYDWTIYDTNGPGVPTTTYSSTALTDAAIDFIHQHEGDRPNDPWFAYQSYNAPHSPYQVPPRELHSVDLSSVGDPAPGTVSNTIPNYKAKIQSLDTEIGRLLAEVDLEKTTVIFIGDNGTPGNVKDTGTGIRGSKGSVYQGGVNVPLIVAGAGVTRRGREDALVVSSDLYATILSLAGVPVSHVNNSYSFKPLLSDEAAASGRVHAFTEIGANASNRIWTIRDTRYKLLYTARKFEIYDLIADPLETTNLYASAPHAAVRATLEAEIAALKAQAPAGSFFP
jgi:arylsulfatase A-like enzyme